MTVVGLDSAKLQRRLEEARRRAEELFLRQVYDEGYQHGVIRGRWLAQTGAKNEKEGK